MHQNSLFELKNRKIFWGGARPPSQTSPLWGGDTPSQQPNQSAPSAPRSPRAYTALDLGAYGASAPGATATGLMGSATPLVIVTDTQQCSSLTQFNVF